MRVCVRTKDQDWHADGLCISYKPSRLNKTEDGKASGKQLFEMGFTYDFRNKEDTVYFAYCLPYTYSKLQANLKSLYRQPFVPSFFREDHFCFSLSGISLPIITITSHIEQSKQNAPVEINRSDFGPDEPLPVHKFKKHVVLTARVHPGESNSSYIMHGLLSFLTSMAPEAVDLRRKCVFKIVPMINPDGVIAGNYRTSLSGNDLNRQFLSPNPKLHPEICALRTLVGQIN